MAAPAAAGRLGVAEEARGGREAGRGGGGSRCAMEAPVAAGRLGAEDPKMEATVNATQDPEMENATQDPEMETRDVRKRSRSRSPARLLPLLPLLRRQNALTPEFWEAWATDESVVVLARTDRTVIRRVVSHGSLPLE